MIKEECEERREEHYKIEKIEKLKETSYDYKVNIVFWMLCSSLELLIRYTVSDKSLGKLIPISIIPLFGYLISRMRTNQKLRHLNEELNSKQK